MYLSKLIIRNFRAIRELNLSLNKGLNIIIGENNSGKSAVIDALRITLGFGKQWRDIGIRNDEDFFIDPTNIDSEIKPIEFHLHFEIEEDEDRQYFHSMLYQDPEDHEKQELQMHFEYRLETIETGSKVLRWKICGGSEDRPLDQNEIQYIYFTYLAALRNAEYELRPYVRENKVTSLYRELTKYEKKDEDGNQVEVELSEEKKIELASKLQSVIDNKDWKGLIKTGESFINQHLEKADIEGKKSRVQIRLLEYKYENIIKGILTRKAVYDEALLDGDLTKQIYFDVSQNGLGENNLIYAATVLGDLENRRNEKIEHYYALLLEEPEAHLHPQRQNTFFNYLNTLGHFDVQIFITSHSPTLTSKSNLDNLIVFQRVGENITALNLRDSELNEIDKQYLERFLDVTKSQLLFARGVILVEGISEALLLPVFACILDPNFDLDKNGIEIININGVSFSPFARLFNSVSPNKRLSSKCSILTDGDQHRYNGNLCPRVLKLQELKPNSETNLEIFLALNTFEHELITQSEANANLIKRVYEELHIRTTLLNGEDLNARSIEFLEKLDQNKDKAIFSQHLAEILATDPEARESFSVPEYIKSAIQWALTGENA